MTVIPLFNCVDLIMYATNIILWLTCNYAYWRDPSVMETASGRNSENTVVISGKKCSNIIPNKNIISLKVHDAFAITFAYVLQYINMQGVECIKISRLLNKYNVNTTPAASFYYNLMTGNNVIIESLHNSNPAMCSLLKQVFIDITLTRSDWV